MASSITAQVPTLAPRQGEKPIGRAGLTPSNGVAVGVFQARLICEDQGDYQGPVPPRAPFHTLLTFSTLQRALLETFTGPAAKGRYSPGVQHTLHKAQNPSSSQN